MDKNINEFKNHALPGGRGNNNIVLMVKDPSWVFTYWELPQLNEIRERLCREDKWKDSRLVLRVYELEGSVWTDSKPYKSYDIHVGDQDDRRYIETGRPGGHFCIDIGFINGSNEFYTLARSNVVWTPLDQISDREEVEWTTEHEMKEYTEQLVVEAKDNPHSLELIQYAEEQMWQESSDNIFLIQKK